jgi:hypothetical protein
MDCDRTALDTHTHRSLQGIAPKEPRSDDSVLATREESLPVSRNDPRGDCSDIARRQRVSLAVRQQQHPACPIIRRETSVWQPDEPGQPIARKNRQFVEQSRPRHE